MRAGLFWFTHLFKPHYQFVIGWQCSGCQRAWAIMSYQAIIIVLALALLLSGVAEQVDNDLNEVLGIKDAPAIDSRDWHWIVDLEVVLRGQQ